MGLKAVRDMVIVKLHEKESIGKIHIPDQAKQYGADFYGEVIDVGPKCRLDVRVGDKLMYFRHEGFKITYEGEEYLALRSRHLLGVFV